MTTSPPSNPTPRSISNLIQHIVLVLPRLKRSPALLPPPIPPVQPVRGLPLHHRHRGKGPKPVKRCVAVEMRRPVTCGQEKGASKEQNRRDDTRGLRMKDETMCVWLEQHISWPSNANTAHYMRCLSIFDPSLIALSQHLPIPSSPQLPPQLPPTSLPISPPLPLLSSLLSSFPLTTCVHRASRRYMPPMPLHQIAPATLHTTPELCHRRLQTLVRIRLRYIPYLREEFYDQGVTRVLEC